MRKAAFCLVLFLLLQLPGRLQPTHNPSISSQVVRSITVSYGDAAPERHYTSPQKLQQILLSIRSLGPMFLPEQDPDALPGPPVCITLTCADGSQRTYQQLDSKYFRTGAQPWRQLQPGKGQAFLETLQQLPGDPFPGP